MHAITGHGGCSDTVKEKSLAALPTEPPIRFLVHPVLLIVTHENRFAFLINELLDKRCAVQVSDDDDDDDVRLNVLRCRADIRDKLFKFSVDVLRRHVSFNLATNS